MTGLWLAVAVAADLDTLQEELLALQPRGYATALGEVWAAAGWELDTELVSIRLDEGELTGIDGGDESRIGLSFSGQGTIVLKPPSADQELGLRQDLDVLGVDGLGPGELTLGLQGFVILSADEQVLGADGELLGQGGRPQGEALYTLAREALGPHADAQLPRLVASVAEDLVLGRHEVPTGRPDRIIALLSVSRPGHPDQTRPMVLLRDGSGVTSRWPEALLWAWRPGDEAFEVALATRPDPQPNPRIEHARATVTLGEPPAPFAPLPLEAELVLQLEATSAPVQAFHVRGRTTHLRGWTLESIELVDGTPVHLERARGYQRSAGRELLVVLPEALQPGSSAALRMRYTALLPFDGAELDGSELVLKGPASPVVMPFPTIGHVGGEGAHGFALEVAVPSGSGLDVLLSTPLAETVDDGDRQWTVGQSAGDQPGFAVGHFYSATREGSPRISVHRYSAAYRDEDETTHELDEAEATIDALEAILGPFPWPAVQLYEGPMTAAGPLWNAAPGLLRVGGGAHELEWGIRHGTFKAPREVVAHELAHAWWGHHVGPETADDHAMLEALATISACLATDTLKPGACARARMRWAREVDGGGRRLGLERSSGASARATRSYSYGPLALWAVAGEDTLREALPLLVARHGGGTMGLDELQAALEEVTGRPLGDEVDFWLRAGRVPDVRVTATVVRRRTRAHLELEVAATPAVGRFTVPVVVGWPEGEQTVWVEVADGHGAARSARFPADDTMRIGVDPYGQVPLHRKELEVVDEP